MPARPAVSARDGHGLDEDVRLFFALTAALLDAGIACWDAKRAYDSVRPITAIRYLFAGREVTA
ncbi:MAG TPA: phosphoesterase, partial [Actinomycetota bacterium]|nr:phosphoesterase [Actinomycetota bacterium]